VISQSPGGTSERIARSAMLLSKVRQSALAMQFKQPPLLMIRHAMSIGFHPNSMTTSPTRTPPFLGYRKLACFY